MDLMALTASLSLDASEYEAGLAGAEQAATGFGGNLGSIFGKAEKLLQGALKAAGTAAIEFGKDVIQTGMGFDKQMGAVEAVLGKTEATTENMARLRAFALEQAHDSIFTAEQTGQAYYYMGMAGWKTEQMLAGLPGVMALAAASGEDLGRVSDIVTDSITAFGLTADDVGMYVDLLAQTATNANTDVSRMGETFKYVAPIAGSLGADVDDVALSIGLMANAGIKGSMAGTALRNIFTRLATNAGATQKDLGALEILTDKLGVSFYDTAGNMRDWGTIITESREAWKGLSQEQQVYYAKQIASQRGMAGWLALMNATEDDVEKLTKALNESSGAAQEMSETRLDNLWGDTIKFNSALDVLKVAIYDDVKGPLREVVQDATESIDNIRGAIEERGLTGGIEQLGTEIEKFGDKWAPALESLGTALAPVLNGLLGTLTGPLTETATKLGAAFGSALIQGLTDSGALVGPVGTLLGGFLGGANVVGKNGGGLFGMAAGGLFNMLTGGVDGGAGILGTDKLSKASAAWDKFVKDHSFGGAEGGGAPNDVTYGMGRGDTEYQMHVEPVITADDLQSKIQAALDSGSSTIEINGESMEIGDAVELQNQLIEAAQDADVASEIDLSGVDASGMESAIASAGEAGGQRAASAIQSALSAVSFVINVAAKVSGLPSTGTPGGNTGGGTPVKENATAMNTGRIFDRPTIFGYADNAYQVAGDAGPEAVVGVRSLGGMIHQYVGESIQENAMDGTSMTAAVAGAINAAIAAATPELASRISAAVASSVASSVSRIQPQRIYFSSGALVGQIKSDMNRALGKTAVKSSRGQTV